jgi:phosphatidylinositol alpha-1,6-mannosyltransferase
MICTFRGFTTLTHENRPVKIKSDRKITFLIRKNPRTIGGVQRHSAGLLKGLSGSFETEKLVWKGPEWAAPIYFPLFYLQSSRNGADLIHCDDAVSGILGSAVKRNTGKKVVATVHGLDVILPIARYQKMVSRALKNLDKVICISAATAKQVKLRGVPPEKIDIIPCSAEKVGKTEVNRENAIGRIAKLTGIDLMGVKVLFSLGRPVRRKGFDYFIKNVFVNLPEGYVYIVAGPPQKIPLWLKSASPFIPEEARKLLLIASGCDSVSGELERLARHPRIHYLKTISEELRDLIFAASDLFIMPNITVPGDMEGFGIVALEAAIRGVPVVATGIEGITDAVIDGENGCCIAENDHEGMTRTIIELTADNEKLKAFGVKAREFTMQRFSPDTVYARYAKLFEELINRPLIHYGDNV